MQILSSTYSNQNLVFNPINLRRSNRKQVLKAFNTNTENTRGVELNCFRSFTNNVTVAPPPVLSRWEKMIPRVPLLRTRAHLSWPMCDSPSLPVILCPWYAQSGLQQWVAWRGRKRHLLRGSVRNMWRKRLFQAGRRPGSLNMFLSRALSACYTTRVAPWVDTFTD